MIKLIHSPENNENPFGSLRAEIETPMGLEIMNSPINFRVFSSVSGKTQWKSDLSPGCWSYYGMITNTISQITRKGETLCEFVWDTFLHGDLAHQYMMLWAIENKGSFGITIGTHNGENGEWVEPIRKGLIEGILVEASVPQFLELSENYVGERYDTIFTSIPSADLVDNRDLVHRKIKSLAGKLLIKYFPPKGVSSKKIEAHIEKMTAAGNKPDLIIVDYADLLLSHSNKNDSTYGEQGGVYIELRGMGGELGIPIWTASQTNRSGIDSEVIEADKIADSYAKVMNADFIMSVSRKSKDKLNNTARVHVMKNRFGMDGITFPTKMDTNKGIIEVFDANSADGIIARKESNSGAEEERQLLHKKYMDTMPLGGAVKPVSGLG